MILPPSSDLGAEGPMKAWTQGVQYAYRYARHKFDAFQAFGPAGANGGSHLPHSVVRPVATYSPWRADRQFQVAFELIRHNTLVDVYRCYDLWQLVAEAGKLPSGEIIEIGVWRGGTGCLMAQRGKLIGLEATVFPCDTFRGAVKSRLFRPSLCRGRAFGHQRSYRHGSGRTDEVGQYQDPVRDISRANRTPGGARIIPLMPYRRGCV